MMTNITNAILDLLLEHDCVIVPGLGAFLCHEESAKVNVITNTFECPSASLSFDSHMRDDNDVVASYVASLEGISLEEARNELQSFVADCFTKMKAGESVMVEGIGVLYLDAQQNVAFEPSPSQNFNGESFGLDDFTAKPVFGIDDAKPSNISPSQPTPGISTQPCPAPEPKEPKKPKKEGKTPVEVDSEKPHHLEFLAMVLRLLVIVVGILALLILLDVIHINLDTLPFHNRKNVHDEILVVADDSTNNDTIAMGKAIGVDSIQQDSEERQGDTVMSEPQNEIESEPQPEPTPVEPVTQEIKQDAAPAYYIIGGCFSMRENAEALVASLHKEGYTSAYVMERGSKMFVCYGGYASIEEANVDLAKIRVYSNNKAWVMKK